MGLRRRCGILLTLKRIYHPWTHWECFKAGFFAPVGVQLPSQQNAYKAFLSDLNAFSEGMSRVFKEWPNSCEHNLTNASMNRVAWLGQAAVCIMLGISSNARGGYRLLTLEQQVAADALAEKYLNQWLEEHANRQAHLQVYSRVEG